MRSQKIQPASHGLRERAIALRVLAEETIALARMISRDNPGDRKRVRFYAREALRALATMTHRGVEGVVTARDLAEEGLESSRVAEGHAPMVVSCKVNALCALVAEECADPDFRTTLSRYGLALSALRELGREG